MTDLGPAERFVAGAIGEPGARRFYLQIVAGGESHHLLAEKGQIDALATQGLETLAVHRISSDQTVVDGIAAGLELDDPGDGNELFRVGVVSIGLSQSELLTVEITSTEEDQGVSFVIAPEQFRAMAQVAIAIVASGRPTCPWCQLPMNDPLDHQCPARNGHGTH